MNVHSEKKGTVLVTGASSGIGRAAALDLAARGYRVFATGRNLAALAELEREAQGSPGRLEAFRLDVTDAESIALAKAEIAKRTHGWGLDVLINNAGFGVVAPMTEVDQADLRRQFDVNVFGLVAVTQAFVPSMRERGRGRVINVSSLGGRMTLPFLGGYNATKYALESISDAMRYELRGFGIDVALIEPGVIRTNFTATSVVGIDRYRDATCPYAGVMTHADEIIERSNAMAVGPDHVARAIRRAVEARRPAARYIAPRRAWVLLQLFRLLPTRWADAIMRRIARLNRVNLALPDAATS